MGNTQRHLKGGGDVSSEVSDVTLSRDWRTVGQAIEDGQFSAEQRRQVVEEASYSAAEQDLIDFILPVLTEDELLQVVETLFTRFLWSAIGKVLGRNVSDTLNTLILTECSDLCDGDVFSRHIMPCCSRGQLDLLMTQLVDSGKWIAVQNVLDAVGDVEHTWSHGDTQVNSSLLRLVADGQWWSVRNILDSGVSDSQRQWAVSIACQRASDWDIRCWTLPLCADDQLEDALAPLVARGLWPAVDRVLHRIVRPAQHRWAVHEACGKADDWSIRWYILPHCSDDDQLDDVLTTLLTRGLWECVDIVLRRGVSAAQHTWVVRHACEKADGWSIRRYILPHCVDDQLDGVLVKLVTRDLWECVDIVLLHGVSAAQHTWVVREACETADDWSMRQYILPHCADDQLDDVLVLLVTRCLRDFVDVVHGVSSVEQSWATSEACQNADFKQCMSHCADEVDEDVITLWESIDTVLHLGVSPEKHKWAVHEACGKADDWVIRRYILPHCADDQLDGVLTKLVARGLWECVDIVLHRGVNPALHRLAVHEACGKAEGLSIRLYILPHCADDQLDHALSTLVARRLWTFVDIALQRGVSPAESTWATSEASLHAGDEDFTPCVLSHCTDDQLVPILPVLVMQGLWAYVGRVLKCGVSPAYHSWAIQEGSQHASDSDFRQHILPHCSHCQLEDVLTTLVTRRLWASVGIVLTQCISPAKHRWATSEAIQHANDAHFIQHILPHCFKSQLGSVLITFVRRRLWDFVGTVLHCGVSPAKHRWAISEACQHADDTDFSQYILPYCTAHQLDDVLIPLVTRRLWKSVDQVLHRGVGPKQRSWATQEGIEHADDHAMIDYILPHCADHQLVNVVTSLVERCSWPLVARALQSGLSPAKHRLVIQEACQRASDRPIIACILPHCTDALLDVALPTLVERGLWQSVAGVLRRGLSPAKHRLVIQEACQRASDLQVIEDILPHCTDDLLDVTLPTLVERRLWKSVARVLRRDLSPAQHRWVIQQACQRASDFQIRWFILPHCADDQLDDILPTLLRESHWECVDRVLHRVVSPARHRWAVTAACEQASSGVISEYILPHCADDQLEDVLDILVGGRLWQSVSIVLQRRVSAAQHRQALREVLQTGEDMFIVWCMLPDYNAEMLRHTDWRHGDLWDRLAENVQRFIRSILYAWKMGEDNADPDDAAFWRYVRNPHYEMKDLSNLLMSLRRSRQEAGDRLSWQLDWDSALCPVLGESVVHFVTETWVSGHGQDTQCPAREVSELAGLVTAQVQKRTNRAQLASTSHNPDMPRATLELCRANTADTARRNPVFGLQFIKILIQQSRHLIQGSAEADVILKVVTCVPVVPDLQCVALTVLLRHKRWDIIRRADLSGVWEQVRR